MSEGIDDLELLSDARQLGIEGRCATCKHWDGPKTFADESDRTTWGECLLISADRRETSTPESARTSDLEGFSSLETRYDFGCVLWEAKTDG